MTRALEHEALRHLLLDMLSSTREVDGAVMASLGEGDWQAISTMARQHRLGPILHGNCQARGSDWPVPEHVRSQWAASYRKSALRSLTLFKVTREIDRAFSARSLPYALLKGAWLSFHAYPHPALRPMRDIDVLVPAEQALAAFDALAEAGFGRRQGDLTPIEHALAHAKHLPALVCPQSGVTIEIHTRLMVDVPNGGPRDTIADSKAVFERLIRQSHAGCALPYLSPTDTLLHLIVHAAYDHRFNIGPTVINDVAATLSGSAIDWDLFWTMARAGEWERGCRLLLALAQCYHGHPGIEELSTDDQSICEATMADAALLMLMDTGAFTSTQVRTALSGIGDLRKNLGFLLGKALPPRHVLSSFARLPADSIKAWAYYPAWLAAQTRQSFFSKSEAATKADSRRLAQIEKWVTAEP